MAEIAERIDLMRKTKIHNKKCVSIKMIIIISFITLMLITVGLIGYIVFKNWYSSTDDTITKIAEDMNNEIYDKIDGFIKIPEHIIKVNKELIEKDIVDINNEIERERFFAGILKSYNDEIYSFSYGTESGEYYGARRNENNIIEIMRNNTYTGGHSWYYSVTDKMTAGELVVDAGKFDPRTREWYRSAKEKQALVFSPIYKHFIMDDLTVSASVPIYNAIGNIQGVLGCHITLSRIDNYLKEIVNDRNAYAIIFEKNSEELISNSMNMENFTTNKGGSAKRLTLSEINNKAIIKSYEDYLKLNANTNTNTNINANINTNTSTNINEISSMVIINSNFKEKNEKEMLHINITEYHKEGIDWIVITAVPSNFFIVDIIDNMKLSALLTLLALIVSIIIYLHLTNKFLRPINSLINTTEKLSKGDLSQRVVIKRNDEIGKISKSFNKMAETISMLVNNLEEKVKERTEELEAINNELKENKDQLACLTGSK